LLEKERRLAPDGRRIKGSAGQRAEARDRLRAELLSAARCIAAETGGFDGVTVRSVADRVGYRAPVVYEYFAGKKALLVSVVEAGFTELAERLGKARCPDVYGPAGGPLLAAAVAYWEFAVENPHLYRLMHTLPDLPFGTPDTPDAIRGCFEQLKAAADLGAPDHAAARHDEFAPADLLWAHLHGLVSLTLDGRIKGGPERAKELLADLTASFASE
jgi:AcrR family transcriptional regulator